MQNANTTEVLTLKWGFSGGTWTGSITWGGVRFMQTIDKCNGVLDFQKTSDVGVGTTIQLHVMQSLQRV